MKSKKAISCITMLLVLSTICRFTVFAEGENIETPETAKIESIKVSVSNTIMQIGETQKLRVSITPPNAENFELEYFSSNANVITAAIGTIIANKEGTADITVKVKGAEISDIITITVIKNEDVLIQGIKIYSENIFLEEREETKIKYDIIPSNATNPKLIFSSLNTSVATVDENGYVYGKNSGTTRIKVQSENGTVIKYVYVTVESYYPKNGNNNSVSVRSVDIYEGDDDVTKTIEIMSTQSKQFTAQIYPSNASDTRIRWKTADEDIAEVDEYGVVTGVSEGTVKIYAIARDNGRQDVITVKIIPYIRYPDSINITPQENAVFETGQVIKFIPSFLPDDTTERNLKWYVYGGAATVDYNGNVSITDRGIITVKAYTSDFRQSATFEFESQYAGNHFSQVKEDFGVKQNRSIIITFNSDISENVARNNIFLSTDGTGNGNPIEVNVAVNGTTIIITPKGVWQSGENYLFIKEGLRDIYGTQLGENLKYKFNVKGGN